MTDEREFRDMGDAASRLPLGRDAAGDQALDLGGVHAGGVPAGGVPAGGVPAGGVPAGGVPTAEPGVVTPPTDEDDGIYAAEFDRMFSARLRAALEVAGPSTAIEERVLQNLLAAQRARAGVQQVMVPVAAQSTLQPIDVQPMAQPAVAQPVAAQPMAQPAVAQPMAQQTAAQQPTPQQVTTQPVPQPAVAQPVAAQPMAQQAAAQQSTPQHAAQQPVPQYTAAQQMPAQQVATPVAEASQGVASAQVGDVSPNASARQAVSADSTVARASENVSAGATAPSMPLEATGPVPSPDAASNDAAPMGNVKDFTAIPGGASLDPGETGRVSPMRKVPVIRHMLRILEHERRMLSVAAVGLGALIVIGVAYGAYDSARFSSAPLAPAAPRQEIVDEAEESAFDADDEVALSGEVIKSTAYACPNIELESGELLQLVMGENGPETVDQNSVGEFVEKARAFGYDYDVECEVFHLIVQSEGDGNLYAIYYSDDAAFYLARPQ